MDYQTYVLTQNYFALQMDKRIPEQDVLTIEILKGKMSIVTINGDIISKEIQNGKT